MTLAIVVEGHRDEQLIGAVMSAVADPRDYRLVVARGKSHALSVAGTMLTLGEGPVVLAIDADTTSERLLSEQRSDLRALLNRAARPELWRVVFFVPEIEAALVHDDVVVQRLFGRPLDEIELALRDVAPKQALTRLLADSEQDWTRITGRLHADVELARLVARAPGMREIVEFAQQVMQTAA